MGQIFVFLIFFIKFAQNLIRNHIKFSNMNTAVKEYIEQFMADIVAKNPGELEFHQAVREVVESVAPYVLENPVLWIRWPAYCPTRLPCWPQTP